MEYIDFLDNYLGIPFFYIKLLAAFLLSLGLSFYTIPVILKISKRKNLMDEPGIRSSHIHKIPNLGGIALFYALAICTPMFSYELFDRYRFLFPALVILLYIGVMDDIVVMRAYKKLFAQVLVAIIMVIGSDVRIRSLFGLFGIYELNYILSVVFSVVTFIIIVNAFNLIDGIDGLSGSYAIICNLIFGVSYLRLGPYNYPMVILCFIIIGALLGFLYYNLSKRRSKKIFMGDTGSMIIGFLLAFTAIYFIDLFIETDRKDMTMPLYHLQTAPIIAFAILILPMVDTLNVITIRLLNKKSPMEADRNHIHHKVLDLGLTHKRATFYIIIYYLAIVGVTYLLRHLNLNLLFAIVLAMGFLGVYLTFLLNRIKQKK
ncbi:glycosyltransferase family 4 protein [Riemerella columbina]|uniref:glycosyltransferase family 4 protein n=1 Tax=Riemerella columbina TaxID=103810 RepID=UPI00266ED8A2|nr:MraY family glycosyltransferase [Riemerella columbina]WKS95266.1 undecaprenyl/decaprenyl-phosphate alpha-N-acetylglucosaminyl 1-phosphate transferase [Riemerella columbina]